MHSDSPVFRVFPPFPAGARLPAPFPVLPPGLSLAGRRAFLEIVHKFILLFLLVFVQFVNILSY